MTIIDIDAVYEMINEVVTSGLIPYMLISPEHVVEELREEFPDIWVYSRDADEIICITAEQGNFVNGEMVLH